MTPRLMLAAMLMIAIVLAAPVAQAGSYDECLQLAWKARQAGEHEQAVRHYLCAIEKSPDAADPRVGIMAPLIELGRLDEAAAYGEALLKEDPANVAAAGYMQAIRERRGGAWTFRPQLHLLGGGYTDQWDKKAFAGGMAAVEGTHRSGYGGQAEYSYAWAFQRYTKDDFAQHAPGAAFFYVSKGTRLWFHWTSMFGNDASQGYGHVFSLAGGHELGALGLGGAIDTGFYERFSTYQVAPEVAWTFGRGPRLSLAPMLQYRAGGFADRKDPPLKPSAQLAVSYAATAAAFSLAVYGGPRWFTVENNGLLVWNSDEDLIAGLRAGATLFPGRIVSGALGLRVDRGARQYGIDHGFWVIGATCGLTGTF